MTYAVTQALCLLCYWQLSSMAASVMSKEGRVEEGGVDLGAPGLHQ